MADEKDPKSRLELRFESSEGDGARSQQGAPGGAAPGPADGPAGGPATGSAPKPPEAACRVRTWVSRSFPGHEHAFWGGVLGLVVAIAFFALGLWRTLVIVALVAVGVAVGQALDGDARLVDLVRRLFTRN